MIFWHVDSTQIVDVGIVEDTYFTGNMMQYHFNPSRLNVTYPSTFNTYHPNSLSEYDITVAGSYINQPYDSLRIKFVDNRTIIFDGWGTLILASGSYPCLRESRQDAMKDSTWSYTSPGPWILQTHKTKINSTIRYYTSISNDPMVRIKYNANNLVKTAYYLVNPSLFTSAETQPPPINFRIFPNPSASEIYILHNLGSGYAVALFDAAGKKVYEKTLTKDIHQVSCLHFSPGIYSCTVFDKNRQAIVSSRVVIE
jgi:hypothetical protein